MGINNYISDLVKRILPSTRTTKVRLPCGKDRIGFETLLELHGATIDRREGLPQHVIYATLPDKNYAACARFLQSHGKRLEPQSKYGI